MPTHKETRRHRFVLHATLKDLEKHHRENNIPEFRRTLEYYKQEQQRYNKYFHGKKPKDFDTKSGFSLVNNRIVYVKEIKEKLRTYERLFKINEKSFIILSRD